MGLGNWFSGNNARKCIFWWVLLNISRVAVLKFVFQNYFQMLYPWSLKANHGKLDFFTGLHYVSPCGVTNRSFRPFKLYDARASPWDCIHVGGNKMQPMRKRPCWVILIGCLKYKEFFTLIDTDGTDKHWFYLILGRSVKSVKSVLKF